MHSARLTLTLASALFVALLVVPACSGGEGATSIADPTSPPASTAMPRDGGAPDGVATPVAECVPACTDGSVCADGKCVAVPNTCPCPTESYCDLATNRCKVGCTEDAQCSKGRYCDTVHRECKAGCRDVGDCLPPANAIATCPSHTCSFVCNVGHHTCAGACADDLSTATCGDSCAACPVPANTNATCDGNACGVTCAAGWYDCNGSMLDGCEHLATPITCYRDVDRDGYGIASATQIANCGVCPIGYTSRSDKFDCNDNNANIYPGEAAYMSPRADYDCDGVVTLEIGQYDPHSTGPCFITFPATMDCGDTRTLPVCAPSTVGTFTRRCR